MIRQGVLWLVTKREFVSLGHFLLLARDWWLGLTKESTKCNLYLKRRFPQIRPKAGRAKITRTIGHVQYYSLVRVEKLNIRFVRVVRVEEVSVILFMEMT